MEVAVPKITSGEEPGSSSEDRCRLVERVAQSELFQRSPRLREFLLYAADCTLSSRPGDLREQVIEERLFGRKPGGQDTIVRVEARNLRKRLDLYFTTEGRAESVIIVMPKGAYALDFLPRQQTKSIKTSENECEPLTTECQPGWQPSDTWSAETTYHQAPAQTSPGGYLADTVTHRAAPAPPPAKTLGTRKLIVGLVVVQMFTCVLAIGWYRQTANLRKQLGITPLIPPFRALFQDGGDVLIVTSDTGMLQISSLLHRPISLDEYIARTYTGIPGTNPPDLARNWNLYEFTDGREMALASMILRQHAQFAQHILLLSGHQLQLQDFKAHNAILIGSPISNPWAQLYEDKLNFRCELSADGRIVFRNKSRRRDENEQYPTEDDIRHNRTYARLVFMPRTSDVGSTLLIAGTTAQSTEAAGEFLLDQNRLSRALHAMGLDPGGEPRFFELLIRSSNFVGGAIMSEVVAWRVSSAPEH